jgi:hypothetical protein
MEVNGNGHLETDGTGGEGEGEEVRSSAVVWEYLQMT